MKLTPIQESIMRGEVCPYCKCETEKADDSEVYAKSYGGRVTLCRPCEAHVGNHKDTDLPKGRLAKKELRVARKQAHKYFDVLWKERYMKRKEAYKWLGEALGIPDEYVHVGMFGLKTCYRVAELSRDKLKEFK